MITRTYRRRRRCLAAPSFPFLHDLSADLRPDHPDCAGQDRGNTRVGVAEETVQEIDDLVGHIVGSFLKVSDKSVRLRQKQPVLDERFHQGNVRSELRRHGDPPCYQILELFRTERQPLMNSPEINWITFTLVVGLRL